MQQFPLLKLPLIPRETTCKLLTTTELFEFSLISPSSADIVRSLGFRAEEHNLTITGDQKVICVRLDKGKKHLYWDFMTVFRPEEMIEERTIGGVLFSSCKKVRGIMDLDEYYCTHRDLERGVVAITKHLSYVFPGTFSILLSTLIISDLRQILLHPHFKKIGSLKLIGYRRLGKEELEAVFNNIQVKKELSINCATADEYPILQALEVDTLYLATSLWMRREHLLKLNCRTAELHDNGFTCEDLSAFAENWKKSENRRLEHVRFQWELSQPFGLIGVESSQWDPNKREKCFILESEGPRQRINCAVGFDLEREDGLLSTFLLQRNGLHTAVHFFVWHERFPERKRIEQLPARLAPLYKQLETLNKRYPDSSSLERMLANPQLKIEEFLETYDILRGMDGEYRPVSIGRANRRVVFDRMFSLIDINRSSID